MKNKMETTIVYWGYIGIMEKKMETIICVRAAKSCRCLSVAYEVSYSCQS